MFRVCFVCTGNICRSPMAEAISRKLAKGLGLHKLISFTSAGTGEWHVGEQADPRTLAALKRAGYSADEHRAKQFDPEWFSDFDLVCTFDRGQLRILRSWAETDAERNLLRPLLSFDPASSDRQDVTDPYYGDDALFDTVRDQIEAACLQLLKQLTPALRAASEIDATTATKP